MNASYDASCTSNSILTSSLALTPAFPGGLIPKSLFHSGLACVMAVLERHVQRNWPRLPAKRQIPAKRPPPVAALRACRVEYDFVMPLAVEDFRTQHRLLHFGAIFFGGILVEHAQLGRIHDYFDLRTRADVRRSTLNRCAYFVLVSQR